MLTRERRSFLYIIYCSSNSLFAAGIIVIKFFPLSAIVIWAIPVDVSFVDLFPWKLTFSFSNCSIYNVPNESLPIQPINIVSTPNFEDWT